MNTLMKTLAASLSLSLLTSTSFAAPPWAEENATDETTPSITEAPVDFGTSPAMQDTPQTDTPSEPQAMTESAPIAEPEATPAETTAVVVEEHHGDVLQMPSEETRAIGVRLLDFPRRGMNTSKVENELGRPTEIIPAIGKPPISRWVYDDRIVYFEYSSVIHVVAR